MPDTQHAANYPGVLTPTTPPSPEPFVRPPCQQGRRFLLLLRLTLASRPGTPPPLSVPGEVLSWLPPLCLLDTSSEHPNALFHLKISSINSVSLYKYFPTSLLFFRETDRKSGLSFFKGHLIKGDLYSNPLFTSPLLQPRDWPTPHWNCSQRGWQFFPDAKSNGLVSLTIMCLTATLDCIVLSLPMFCSLGFHDTPLIFLPPPSSPLRAPSLFFPSFLFIFNITF